jgi:DegV family protein with EDD domain
MDQDLIDAFVCGYERLVSWADLLDRINVFPVADSDTGCNLRLSLAPLRQFDGKYKGIIPELFSSATGNSGNIAVGFFSGLLLASSPDDLLPSARQGRDKAWRAVGDPKPGTILTFFDELLQGLAKGPARQSRESVAVLMDHLKEAVWSTSDLLPELKRAGVVDAGALGMFIYMEGFFMRLVGQKGASVPITELFQGRLQIASSYEPEAVRGCCVNTVVRLDRQGDGALAAVSQYGQSVVAVADGPYLKMHLHTENPQAVRDSCASFGDLIRWSDSPISPGGWNRTEPGVAHQAIHVMTDGAGSLTRETARELEITLLDSYVIVDHKPVPETLCHRSELYSLMRRGIKVSTAQASQFERSQVYLSILEQYKKVLYLCVGSAFTGYYAAAAAWKGENDPDDRLVVIDSGAASGRLATMAVAVARYSRRAKEAGDVIGFAKEAVGKCGEYVFLDRLKYLSAGGRLSSTRSFFGDLLHMKPVITPTAQGARQVGLVRDRDEQLEFALERLRSHVGQGTSPLILLQYTDNQAWVSDSVKGEIQRQFSLAEIVLQPLSASSGAHMGPGTWAVAFLPESP